MRKELENAYDKRNISWFLVVLVLLKTRKYTQLARQHRINMYCVELRCTSYTASVRLMIFSGNIEVFNQENWQPRYNWLLSSVLWCPHKTMFGPSLPPVVCLCLIHVICVCMRIVVSNTYCVVFFFRLVYRMLPVSLDCPCWIAPSLTFIYIVECRVLTVEMIANTYQCKVLKTFKTKQYTVIIYISQK